MNPIQSLCALALLAALMAVVSCNKDETIVKVYEGPDEMQKRDKFSKGFNSDYSHLRFGRADPDLVIPPYYNPYYDKRASYGNDYGHMRFGRRGPSASFTDYGHLRFGR